MSQSKTIQGPNGLIPVRAFLVGDEAFSLAPYMQKSFTGEPRPHTEEHACHIRTRRVIENACGRLKGRFRVLKAGKLNDPKGVSDITMVYCA